MANLAKNSYRSRLTQNTANRCGPQGFHKNPQDFSGIAHQIGYSSAQDLLRRRWNFLTERTLARAAGLSTRMASVTPVPAAAIGAPVVQKAEQVQFAFGA